MVGGEFVNEIEVWCVSGRDCVCSVTRGMGVVVRTSASLPPYQPELAPGRGHDRAAVLLDEGVGGHAHRVRGGHA